tara:strand:+ start:236 stop:799 length:564 start_codon:yes stop_codon:yes gene_type:complete
MIKIIDNWFDKKTAERIHNFTIEELTYKYGRKSAIDKPCQHWTTYRTGAISRDEFPINTIQKSIIDRFGSENGFSEIGKTYVNTYTFGTDPHIHCDNGYRFSAIYYPLLDWELDWDGGTFIYKKDRSDVEKYVAYKGNRMLFFESDYPHKAGSVSRECFRDRPSYVSKMPKHNRELDYRILNAKAYK